MKYIVNGEKDGKKVIYEREDAHEAWELINRLSREGYKNIGMHEEEK